MSQLIMFQSGGFTNYGICYRKYSLDELKTRTNPKETEENVSKRTVRLHTEKSK